MSFNASDYLAAAREHVDSARRLYDIRFYVLAHYVAGLAVECLLRAYRSRVSKTFDERHDLMEIFKKSGFGDIVPDSQRERIGAAIGDVVSRWQNDHRYRSEESLRRYLKKKKLNLKIKGDFVKENSRRIVNAAWDLVTIGAKAWSR
ncbi:MAG: HEPN domain-containing protein [Phycisphaerae bacterium]|nr:HEPN domain-containing protein [Phycisphaerae bacterium]